jgi:hypothetical protein
LCTRAQDLEIHAHAYPNKEVAVIMFDGLSNDTIFNSWLSSEGKVVVPIKKEGFILIEFNGKQVYPMIYTSKENRFLLGTDGRPDFTGSPQNRFLFRHLARRQVLFNQQMIIREALLTFASDDTLIHAFRVKQSRNEDELMKLGSLYADSSGYTGAVFISSLQLIERSYRIRTTEELAEIKKEFRKFIQNHYSEISSSDLLQQFANQYMMMNEYVVVGKDNMENQVAQDISDWMVLLKDHYTQSDVVHYFLHYFISRMMVTMSGSIFEKFPDLSDCPVHSATKIRTGSFDSSVKTRIEGSTMEKLLPQEEHQKSVWVVMDVDCPASIAGQILLNRFITQQKISFNVITVFCGRSPGQDDYRMLPDVKKSVLLPEGLSMIGKTPVNVTKYPAFILMNSSNKIESVDYTLQGIYGKLMKLKNPE